MSGAPPASKSARLRSIRFSLLVAQDVAHDPIANRMWLDRARRYANTSTRVAIATGNGAAMVVRRPRTSRA